MKVAIILCLLVAGSQANFFDDLKTSFSGIGSAFTDTFHQVGEQAKVVGGQLLQTAKEQGSQLASQALQSLLLGTMNALTPQQTSNKRDLSTLVQQGSQLHQMATNFVQDKTDALKNLLSGAVGQLQQLAGSTDLSTLIPKVDSIVQGHSTLSNQFKQDLLTGLANMFQQAFQTPSNKRDLMATAQEVLKNLNVNLDAVFSHFTKETQDIVHKLGEQLIVQALKSTSA